MELNHLHHLIAQARQIYPDLTSFKVPYIAKKKAIDFTQEEALDLIGNITIDLSETYDQHADGIFTDVQVESIYQSLVRAYLYFRPLMVRK